MSNAPFHIDEGLALERPIAFLRWDASIEALVREGRPTINHFSPEPGAFLVWKDSSIFDGLECEILYRSDFPNTFRIRLRIASTSKAPVAYRNSLAELIARLGNPAEHGDKRGRPWARWNFGAVCVWLRISESIGPSIPAIVISKPDTPPFSFNTARIPDPRFNQAQQMYQDRIKKAAVSFRNVCWREVFPEATVEEMREWDRIFEQIDHYSWDLADLVRNQIIDEADAKRMLTTHYPMLDSERAAVVWGQAMFGTMW